MVWNGIGDSQLIDLSFMVTLNCDLECPFCMYDSSPKVQDQMPFGALQNFISTIQPGRINSFGFYGGEPSIHPLEFDWVMSMVEPYAKPLFVITNGAWSMDTARTKAFLRWMGRRNAQVFVSGTPFHQRHQNQAVLDAIINDPFYGGLFNLKSGETDFLPMGKLSFKTPRCTQRCVWDARPLRLAVKPDGNVIYQTCDGVYPVVGTISETFSAIVRRVDHMRSYGFADYCPHYRVGDKKAA
jgi:hypothetical protein